MADDELVSQFLMFTGTDDVSKASSYLEMAAGNLERAVGLFMDHSAPAASSGGGGLGGGLGGGGGARMEGDEIRAPDATQTMRLMDDDVGPMGGGIMMSGGMMHPYMQLDRMFGAPSTAFGSRPLNVREAVNSAAAAAADSDDEYKENGMDESKDDGGNYNDEDDDDDDSDAEEKNHIARLADMFAPPEHLMYSEGGFEGARNMAKDSKRWLLVNIQKDSEFASHALNRDVWRDELVDNLVREGFILWQTFDMTPEGRVYIERYKVYDFPHIGIIDPRTRRLMWKKEGWTQQNPVTPEFFAETAMDFCSRHSFDKPPQAPRPPGGLPAKRPMNEMSEDEQLKTAMRESLQDSTKNEEGNDDSDYEMDDDDDAADVEYVGSSHDDDLKPAAIEIKEDTPKELSLLDDLLTTVVGDEAVSGARIQLRMPDGKRIVRQFDPSQNVKVVYAFIAQSNAEAKGGREFVLMAGFPPKDLLDDMHNTIDNCKLSGQAITIRWK